MEAKEYLEVSKLDHAGDFKLEISFSNGVNKQVDLSDLLSNPPPVFKSLVDKAEFAKVTINPVGGIAWACGADLSAEYLYNLS